MAVQLDSGEYLARTANLPALSGCTLAAWGAFASAPSGWRMMLSIGNTSDSQIGLGHTGAGGGGFGVGIWPANRKISPASAPGANVPFFLAATINGTGTNAITVYSRLSSETALSSATGDGQSSSVTAVRAGTSTFDGTDDFNGKIWNVKVWDRVLSAAELLIESYYRPMMFPASVNFHWRLYNASDTQDVSGNGRNATSTGTISTVDGSFGLWQPRQKLFVSVASAPPATGYPWPYYASMMAA